MKDHKLFADMDVADMDVADDGRGGTSGRESRGEPPRLRRADRSQVLMLACELDALLPDDHQARMLVAALDGLDLSPFYDSIQARGSTPGRSATDPKLLLGLWLYATADGVGCGRRIERLCECHDAYRWLRGGVTINYHTLNDFRVEHDAALDALFTSLLTALVSQNVISVERVIRIPLVARAFERNIPFDSVAQKGAFEYEPSAQAERFPGVVTRTPRARARGSYVAFGCACPCE